MTVRSGPGGLAMRVPLRASRISWYLLCAVLGVSMLLPLLWMLSIALKSGPDVNRIPPQFLPHEFQWSNFVDGPKMVDFYRLLANTVIVTVLSTIGSVVSSMLVGYGLARIKFRGRKFWFYAFTASIFMPQIVGLIPLQRLWIDLGLIDTWVPLIVPSFLGAPIFVFLARQYFLAIPFSLDEAAKIDGAGHLRIFWSIMIPLTRPVWITIAILSFQLSWNDYLNPLVYLQSAHRFTLSLGMAGFVSDSAGQATSQYNLFMATNLLYMLPPLLLFFFAQRHFMQGIGALGMNSK
ncbi:carbohydrate ABC transporter permease [Actinoallomurus soli]|uniref:carbohydrate ABC transporter permease n=1 Tax=Actinoallomurus soli TaxID=2952535 RepID=UPI002092DBDF|nr:carbohydrate ABC transporter permease [Actinoallomurus soli]MCO5970571.1 carbohydrate ABC transporter permease [Actinoallomurus soli]